MAHLVRPTSEPSGPVAAGQDGWGAQCRTFFSDPQQPGTFTGQNQVTGNHQESKKGAGALVIVTEQNGLGLPSRMWPVGSLLRNDALHNQLLYMLLVGGCRLVMARVGAYQFVHKTPTPWKVSSFYVFEGLCR